MIELKEIEKLAELARIELQPEEKASLRKEIEAILSYVDQVKAATVAKKNELLEPVRNIMRADENPHESGLHTDAILTEAPEREGNYLKVKKIL